MPSPVIGGFRVVLCHDLRPLSFVVVVVVHHEVSGLTISRTGSPRSPNFTWLSMPTQSAVTPDMTSPATSDRHLSKFEKRSFCLSSGICKIICDSHVNRDFLSAQLSHYAEHRTNLPLLGLPFVTCLSAVFKSVSLKIYNDTFTGLNKVITTMAIRPLDDTTY